MKVFSTLLTVAASLSPNDFLLGEGGVQRDPNEHVKTLQYFLENDLTGHGEIDHPVEIDPKEAVLTLVTETTTNEDTTEADVALANALLNDYIKPDGKDVPVDLTKGPELQVLPSDPLLKDLMLHANKNYEKTEVGSGEVPDSTTSQSVTQPTSVEIMSSTTISASTTSTSAASNDTDNVSSTTLSVATPLDGLVNSSFSSTSESTSTSTFTTSTLLEESSTSTSSSTSASSASTSNTSTSTSTSETAADNYQTSTIEAVVQSEATTGKISKTPAFYFDVIL